MLDAPSASCGHQVEAQVGRFFIAALKTDVAGTAEIDAQRSVRRKGELPPVLAPANRSSMPASS